MKKKYIVISKYTFRQRGLNVIEVTQPGLRINIVSITSMKQKLTSIMLNNKNSSDSYILIYQLFDNSFYGNQKKDGHFDLAYKGHDGYYHINGSCDYADINLQLVIYNMCLPLFQVVCKQKIIITSLPRYLFLSCCGNPYHIPNRKTSVYNVILENNLKEMESNITNYLKSVNIESTILNPYDIFTRTDWRHDPIHPEYSAYSKIVSKILYQ